MVHIVCEQYMGALAMMKLDIDLVLMDVNMPEMSGREVLRALNGKGVSTPVIVLTADIQKTTHEECLLIRLLSPGDVSEELAELWVLLASCLTL